VRPFGGLLPIEENMPKLETPQERSLRIVVGSHGFGPVRRRLLGSVSQAIALQAPCSVEIVRCPHPAA
jgi:hypothetical protein